MYYFVEMTDTYAGEANYSWVRRFKVKAKTERGAITKVNREVGPYRLKKDYDDGSNVRHNAAGACICFFTGMWHDSHADYSNIKEI